MRSTTTVTLTQSEWYGLLNTVKLLDPSIFTDTHRQIRLAELQNMIAENREALYNARSVYIETQP